jgi:hypothetical protein
MKAQLPRPWTSRGADDCHATVVTFTLGTDLCPSSPSSPPSPPSPTCPSSLSSSPSPHLYSTWRWRCAAQRCWVLQRYGPASSNAPCCKSNLWGLKWTKGRQGSFKSILAAVSLLQVGARRQYRFVQASTSDSSSALAFNLPCKNPFRCRFVAEFTSSGTAGSVGFRSSAMHSYTPTASLVRASCCCCYMERSALRAMAIFATHNFLLPACN